MKQEQFAEAANAFLSALERGLLSPEDQSMTMIALGHAITATGDLVATEMAFSRAAVYEGAPVDHKALAEMFIGWRRWDQKNIRKLEHRSSRRLRMVYPILPMSS